MFQTPSQLQLRASQLGILRRPLARLPRFESLRRALRQAGSWRSLRCLRPVATDSQLRACATGRGGAEELPVPLLRIPGSRSSSPGGAFVQSWPRADPEMWQRALAKGRSGRLPLLRLCALVWKLLIGSGSIATDLHPHPFKPHSPVHTIPLRTPRSPSVPRSPSHPSAPPPQQDPLHSVPCRRPPPRGTVRRDLWRRPAEPLRSPAPGSPRTAPRLAAPAESRRPARCRRSPLGPQPRSATSGAPPPAPRSAVSAHPGPAPLPPLSFPVATPAPSRPPERHSCAGPRSSFQLRSSLRRFPRTWLRDTSQQSGPSLGLGWLGPTTVVRAPPPWPGLSARRWVFTTRSASPSAVWP